MKERRIKAHWLLWAIIALSFFVSLAVYSRLPEQMPVHWNLAGEVDRYDPKSVGAFAIPALNAFLLFILVWAPAIDPKRKSYPKFEKVYKLIQWLTILFLTGMHFLVLAWSLGYELSISFFAKLGVGIMFIFLGNYMGKTRTNWFFGIRTPWTLENEEVWLRTHRLGGPLMVLAGIITLILAFFNHEITFWLMLGVIFIASFIPIIYSYLLYRRLN